MVLTFQELIPVEVKASDPEPSPAFAHFGAALGEVRGVQLVHQLTSADRSRGRARGTLPIPVEVREAAAWLDELDLTVPTA